MPDTFEGEQWQCMKVFEAGITKAGGIEAAKLRPALEDLEIESVKGKVFMRKCDHQGVQQGFMVEVVKKPGFDTPVPEVIATFPGDSTTPDLQHDDVQGLACDVARSCPLLSERLGEGLARTVTDGPSLDRSRKSGEERLDAAHEHPRLPADADRQRAVAVGPAVLPRRRPDADLRPDADRELRPRRALHAGRLRRLLAQSAGRATSGWLWRARRCWSGCSARRSNSRSCAGSTGAMPTPS